MKLNANGSCWGNPRSCGGAGLICDHPEKVHGAFSPFFKYGTNNEAE